MAACGYNFNVHDMITDNAWGDLMSCLKLFPDCAKMPSPVQDLPLHSILATSGPEDVVAAFHSAYPATADLPSSTGDYPLHLALSRNYTDATCHLLITSAACTNLSGLGETALFTAISKAKSLPLTTAILAGHPEAAATPDEMDNLPLHECVRVNSPRDVLKLVHDAYPEAKGVENGDGEMVEVEV